MLPILGWVFGPEAMVNQMASSLVAPACRVLFQHWHDIFSPSRAQGDKDGSRHDETVLLRHVEKKPKLATPSTELNKYTD